MKLAVKILKGHIANMEGDVIAMESEQSKAVLDTKKLTIQLTIDHYNKHIDEHKEAIARLI